MGSYRGVFVAFCPFLVACSPPLRCELGTGATAFYVVENGTRLPIIYGAQGGYHIWGALATNAESRVRADAWWRLAREDGTWESAALRVPVRMEPLDLSTVRVFSPDVSMNSPKAMMDFDIRSACLGTTVFADEPEMIRGHSVRMTVRLIAEDGASCEDSRLIIPY